jgi:hypothetical protein
MGIPALREAARCYARIEKQSSSGKRARLAAKKALSTEAFPHALDLFVTGSDMEAEGGRSRLKRPNFRSGAL